MKTLADYRKSKQLNQTDVASYLNVSQSTVCQWESGEYFPRIDKLMQLSKLLEVDVEELIESIQEAKENK